MREPWSITRHRFTAIANGVVIGMGIMYALIGNPFGIILLAVGILMEYWQRRRNPESR